MTNEIKQSYLMWVGAKHYETIEDYVQEAVKQGVSKRMANTAQAKALVEPGTVVFLAHDEGEYEECPHCQGVIDCPECRKVQSKIDKLVEEREELEKKEASEGVSYEKQISRLNKRISKREDKQENCPMCDGLGRVENMGTGGAVSFNDGTEMDFRQYMYWNRLPWRWTEDVNDGVLEMDMCEECGGKGSIPKGAIFGMFVPTGIEYVLNEEDDEKVKKEMEENGVKVITKEDVLLEAKRGCGFRHGGGIYVVTSTEEVEVSIEEKIEELKERGLIEDPDAQVNGNFAQFLNTVPLKIKRFRGMKKWSLDPRAEDEAELAIEALTE